MNDVLNVIELKLTDAENQLLTTPYTPKEVTDVLSKMSPLKSSGPDGFPALFYKRFWHVIGPTVTVSVLEFLNSNILPSLLNYTFIVLIPEVKNPSKITLAYVLLFTSSGLKS